MPTGKPSSSKGLNRKKRAGKWPARRCAFCGSSGGSIRRVDPHGRVVYLHPRCDPKYVAWWNARGKGAKLYRKDRDAVQEEA